MLRFFIKNYKQDNEYRFLCEDLNTFSAMSLDKFNKHANSYCCRL